MPSEFGQTGGLLSPYRVLDLTDESGFLCGKVLADLGAEVIKIEPPEGDAARQLGPFPGDVPDPEKGLYWIGYNAGKRGITLNLQHRAGQELLAELVRSADFLIDTCPPSEQKGLGLDHPTLRGINPALVQVSITPFGQDGPYRDYLGGDLVAMATSGMMSLVGEPDGAPLRVSLPQAPMWTGMYAAAGALVAHYHRELHNTGQQVDISLQTGLLWSLANAPSFWSTNRTGVKRKGREIVGRSITGSTMQAIFKCRDGYLNFIMYGGAAGRRSNKALVDWMAEEGLPVEHLQARDWSKFDIQHTTQEEVNEFEEPAEVLFLRCTKAEFLAESFKRGILAYPVATVDDILVDGQLEARDFWQSIVFPTLGDQPLRFPGPFAKFSETPLPDTIPAPRIGQHNHEVFGKLGRSREQLDSLKAEGII